MDDAVVVSWPEQKWIEFVRTKVESFTELPIALHVIVGVEA